MQQKGPDNFMSKLYDEKAVQSLSLFELKEGYLGLKKQFVAKHQTVSALQRNFETLTKLVIAEQEAKEALLVQTKHASERLQD